MGDDNIVERRVLAPKARKTNLHHHPDRSAVLRFVGRLRLTIVLNLVSHAIRLRKWNKVQ